jgi:hypothetical protein
MISTATQKVVVARAMELWADPKNRVKFVWKERAAMCAVQVLSTAYADATGDRSVLKDLGAQLKKLSKQQGEPVHEGHFHAADPQFGVVEEKLAPIVEALGYSSLAQIMHNNDIRELGQDHLYSCMRRAHEKITMQLVTEAASSGNPTPTSTTPAAQPLAGAKVKA